MPPDTSQRLLAQAQPEDYAQRALVDILTPPVGANETDRMVRRVEQLHTWADTMVPIAAKRLDERLRNRSDPLTQLFDYKLATATRTDLRHRIAESASHYVDPKSVDRGTDDKGTQDTGTKPPPPPQKPEKKPEKPQKPPVIPPPTGDYPQVPQPKDPPEEYLRKLLKLMAKGGEYGLGALMAGVFGVGAGLAGGAIALGINHVWTSLSATKQEEIVQAIKEGTKGLSGTDAYGRGNEIAFQKLREIIGRPVLDLNSLKIHTPLLDSIGPDGVYGLKGKGAVTARKIGGNMLTYYVEDFQQFFNEKRLKGAAEVLTNHAKEIQSKGMWPTGLPPGTSTEQIAGYIRDNAKLVVPWDHVQGVKALLGQDAYVQPSLYGIDPSLSDTDRVPFIQRLVNRVESSGITSEILGKAVGTR
jgi:hypothetical protein